MKILCKLILACLSAVMLTFPVLAAERGTSEEAVALVKKGVAYVKAHGREKAFAEFSSLSGQFVDRVVSDGL